MKQNEEERREAQRRSIVEEHQRHLRLVAGAHETGIHVASWNKTGVTITWEDLEIWLKKPAC